MERRGWMTEMYLSTDTEMVMYMDITKVVWTIILISSGELMANNMTETETQK